MVDGWNWGMDVVWDVREMGSVSVDEMRGEVGVR